MAATANDRVDGPARLEPPSQAPQWGREAVTLLCAGAVLLAAMTALGLVLTHVFDHSTLIRDDRSLSDALFRQRNATLTSITWWLTQFAEALTVVVLAGVIGLTWRLRSGWWFPAMFLLAALLGESSIYVLITTVVHRHRPLIKHLDAAPPTSSFPSGHVAASICLYGGLAFLTWHFTRRRSLRVLLVALAVAVPACVATARVYRGMHYPTDVAAGALLGAVWLAVVIHVLGPEIRRRAGHPVPGAGHTSAPNPVAGTR